MDMEHTAVIKNLTVDIVFFIQASISLPSHITSRISETFIGVDRKKNTPIYPPQSNNLIKKHSVG